MRRTFASLLLAIFSAQLISPALFANRASKVPACCQRDGKHRCGMVDAPDSSRPAAGAAVKAARLRCPQYPSTGAFQAFNKTFLPRILIVSGPANLFQPEFHPPAGTFTRSSFRGLVYKRGPPVNFS